MKLVSVNKLEPGLVVSENIFTLDDRLVLPKGTILDENDIETIRSHQTELINLYSIIKYSLESIAEVAGEKEEEKEKADITNAQLTDAYKTIIEVSSVLDYDTLSFVLSSLSDYNLPDDDAKVIKKVNEYAYKLSWDKITEIVKNRLGEREKDK